MWEKVSEYIKKAGAVIILVIIVLAIFAGGWFTRKLVYSPTQTVEIQTNAQTNTRYKYVLVNDDDVCYEYKTNYNNLLYQYKKYISCEPIINKIDNTVTMTLYNDDVTNTYNAKIRHNFFAISGGVYVGKTWTGKYVIGGRISVRLWRIIVSACIGTDGFNACAEYVFLSY